MFKSRYSLLSLAVVFLTLLAIFGSLSYILFGLGIVVRLSVVLGSLILTYYLKHFFKKNTEQELKVEQLKLSFTRSILLSILYIILFILGLSQLLSSQTTEPILSPWQVLPSSYLLLYGLATACLFFILPSIKKSLRLLFLVTHYTWSCMVAVIIYGIGYGFDPFIHQATVTAIENLGRVFPLTFYYLGQYSLVTILHTLFGLTISFWDKLLVPGLAALLIPLVAYQKLKNHFSYSSLIILGLLLLPFSIIIVTTPQNLAYLFLILLIFWSLNLSSTGDYIILSLLSIAALVTQPIAGIPALLFVVWLILQKITKPKFQPTLHILVNLLFILTLPLAFYLFTYHSYHESFILNLPALTDFLAFLVPQNPVKENWYLDLTYLFSHARGLVYLLLIMTGVMIASKNKLPSIVCRYGLPSLALICSALLTSAINFHFLIDYERYDYPERIITVAVIFALPFVIITLEKLFIRLQSSSYFVRSTWFIFLSACLTISLYLSYPRFDHYYNSHGYATSAADITAVTWIHEHGKATPYIVLANQQVSAAAIKQFGFAQYYNDLFYYPVPTGGPLYQYYLELVKKPTRESVIKAMDLAQVTNAYVVLNDYWWAADKLGPELAAIADEAIALHGGQIQIFWFVKK